MDSVISAAMVLKLIAIYAVANEMKFLGKPMGQTIAEKIWFLSAYFVKHMSGFIGNMTKEILDFRSSVGENYVEEGLKKAEIFIENDLKPYLEKIKKDYREEKHAL